MALTLDLWHTADGASGYYVIIINTIIISKLCPLFADMHHTLCCFTADGWQTRMLLSTIYMEMLGLRFMLLKK